MPVYVWARMNELLLLQNQESCLKISYDRYYYLVKYDFYNVCLPNWVDNPINVIIGRRNSWNQQTLSRPSRRLSGLCWKLNAWKKVYKYRRLFEREKEKYSFFLEDGCTLWDEVKSRSTAATSCVRGKLSSTTLEFQHLVVSCKSWQMKYFLNHAKNWVFIFINMQNRRFVIKKMSSLVYERPALEGMKNWSLEIRKNESKAQNSNQQAFHCMAGGEEKLSKYISFQWVKERNVW